MIEIIWKVLITIQEVQDCQAFYSTTIAIAITYYVQEKYNTGEWM